MIMPTIPGASPAQFAQEILMPGAGPTGPYTGVGNLLAEEAKGRGGSDHVQADGPDFAKEVRGDEKADPELGRYNAGVRSWNAQQARTWHVSIPEWAGGPPAAAVRAGRHVSAGAQPARTAELMAPVREGARTLSPGEARATEFHFGIALAVTAALLAGTAIVVSFANQPHYGHRR
jgi:hypothetical protein